MGKCAPAVKHGYSDERIQSYDRRLDVHDSESGASEVATDRVDAGHNFVRAPAR